ncbi:uncharacterized protein VICG_01339 [Vittaforma corneae ATCC 50505]|uniref:Replication factor C subunit 1 n=1 Tax=Vittaforma corneae (strain ATCC 50505) TaxID=993615 RepID=L2GL82_VITCO|nr:uncharacterized protein VICG_01339 [Vittaforma corneae ATCC 50505]ELA41591.1 hypothetical protein VICG_01339 [Vittaforma corneae ATCC 50505]
MSNEPLKGNVFVFTGEMSMDREEAKSRVLLLGARVTTSVSSKTTYLITGSEPGPSKIEKAKELGTKILSEEKFLELLDKYSFKMAKAMQTSVSSPMNTKLDVKTNHRSWAEKYRPATVEEIVGNKTAIEQLRLFIQNGTEYKAALLSGPPGVGKTTAVLAVCREQGITPIEFNASDLRSKKMLAETISNCTSNLSISKDWSVSKSVIVMDEVDGMTSDKGGIPELVSIIKKTKVPVICICNDKTHQKMRTLSSYCLDIRFRKLDPRTIMPRIKIVLEKEGKTLPEGAINEIIMNSNGDIRYILNTIQSLVMKPVLNLDFINKTLVKKNILKGTFEIAAELFQKRGIAEKIDLYFEDNSLMPLFVQENYLKCAFRNLKEMLASAESISMSDIIDSRIHGTEQEWSLMPYHAFFSCVYPLHGRLMHKRLDFPLYLGQYSKFGKNNRLLTEICYHFRPKVTRKSFRLFVGELIFKRFTNGLQEGNIGQSIKVLESTDLLKEDAINLGELIGSNSYQSISAKYKMALTREYNKLRRRLPYATGYAEGSKDESDEDY